MFLQVHNAKTQSLITNISTDGWLVLALSGRGDTLATFSRQTNGHFLRFWDPISWRERGSVVLPKDAINPFVPLETQLSVNENMIACVRGAGFVSVLEIPSGRTVAS
jgi:hypothetical protein